VLRSAQSSRCENPLRFAPVLPPAGAPAPDKQTLPPHQYENARSYHQPYPHVSVSRLGRAAWVAGLIFTAAALAAQTVSTGTITGVVSNSATGANLEGAQVTVQPGNLNVFTEREGRFAIPNLPPGVYTLDVFYSGLDAKSIQARVEPGMPANYEIGLTSNIYQLSRFVVEGEREGNALAITQRRNAGG
jgi:hypothetical protein